MRKGKLGGGTCSQLLQGQREDEMILSARKAALMYALLVCPGLTAMLMAQNVSQPNNNPVVLWLQHPLVVVMGFSGFLGGIVNVLAGQPRRASSMAGSLLLSTVMCMMILPLLVVWLYKDADIFVQMPIGFMTGVSADKLFPKIQRLFGARAVSVIDTVNDIVKGKK